jgi:uncharacterized RDD family membrane protein YckC
VVDHQIVAPAAGLGTGVAASEGPSRVGFWPRVGASLIDVAVVAALGVALADLAAALFPGYTAEVLAHQQAKTVAAQTPGMSSLLRSVARWAAAAELAAVVYGLAEGLFGRALGKLLLGLRIADTSGRAASLPRLLGRMAVKQSGALLALTAMVTGSYFVGELGQIPAWAVMIGFLLVLGHKRQALHDRASGTAVYRNTDVIVAP